MSWVYHVAPTLCVRRGLLRTGTVVIDPSLFGGPVTRATWVGVQGDPTATLADTDCSAYYRAPGGAIQTDPAYTKTDMYLATYRLKLKNRSLGPDGPPPYTCP